MRVASNITCSLFGLRLVDIVRYHDDQLYRCTAGSAVESSLVPKEEFDPESMGLLSELATKGSITGDDNRDPIFPSKKGSENSEGFSRTSG